jgi:hypothetical protein
MAPVVIKGVANDSPNSLNLIIARREFLEGEVGNLSAKIGAMQTAINAYRDEIEELSVAEKVMTRLEADNLRDLENRAADLGVIPPPPAPPLENRKPDGIPTVAEMIVTSLTEALGWGVKGQEPRQIADYIAKKWWPDVNTTDVGPIAWRMWKKGQLEKNGSTYLLPRTDSERAAQRLMEVGQS